MKLVTIESKNENVVGSSGQSKESKCNAYNCVLKNIVDETNKHKDYEIEDRLKLIHTHLADWDDTYKSEMTEDQKHNLDVLVDFFSSEHFRKQNGEKKKKDLRAEEYYYSKVFDTIGYYLLDKWDTWHDRNGLLDDYIALSPYQLDKIKKDAGNKRVIGFNTTVIDDYLADEASSKLNKNLELHVDYMLQFTGKSDVNFRISEDEKRKQRKQAIIDNIDKDPMLKANYDEWQKIGLIYGFDESYSKEEKENIKQSWLKAFALENHPVSPEQRYHKLNKMYNQIGYDLSAMLEQLRKPSVLMKEKQSPRLENDAMDDVFSLLDWENPDHIKAMLKIDRVSERDKKDIKRYKEISYYPIYHVLKDKYRDKIDSIMKEKINEFDKAVKFAGLNDVERDIIQLVMGEHDEYSVLEQMNHKKKSDDHVVNPFQLITEYINKKYGLSKSKANIIHMIEKKISKKIAKSYRDLQAGIEFKKCTYCGEKKLMNSDNFGTDKRNKDNLKSVCRMCLAKKEREKRK